MGRYGVVMVGRGEWWGRGGGVKNVKFMIIYQVNTPEVTKKYIFQYLDHICPTIFFCGAIMTAAENE